MRLESAFGGTTKLRGGVFESDVELPIWTASCPHEGHIMVMQPAGNGNEHLSPMCENSEGCGESDLPVSSLASSGNYGRRFEVELAEGGAVSVSISEIIGTRRMTVERAETEETIQSSIEINGNELYRVNDIVRFMAGRGFNTWRIH